MKFGAGDLKSGSLSFLMNKISILYLMKRLLQIVNKTVQIKSLVSCFTLREQVTNMLAITRTIITTMFQKDHHGRI